MSPVPFSDANKKTAREGNADRMNVWMHEY